MKTLMQRRRLRPAVLLAFAVLVCFCEPAAAQGVRGEASWRLAFELAFGTGSPYESKFPNLYELPYETNRAITKEVLDRVVQVALRESGARRVRLRYLPGGYMEFDVVPSAQLDARASERQVRTALCVVGYLAQQTLVIASGPDEGGERAALLVLQTDGRQLADPAFAQRFWRRLSALEPRLNPGFSGAEERGRPGLYLIDTEGDWPADPAPLDEAVAAASHELKIQTSVTRFRVRYLGLGNDWKQHTRGEEYLRRLTADGRAPLARRLARLYRPRAERWIAAAFRRHAPRVVRSLAGAY